MATWYKFEMATTIFEASTDTLMKIELTEWNNLIELDEKNIELRARFFDELTIWRFVSNQFTFFYLVGV